MNAANDQRPIMPHQSTMSWVVNPTGPLIGDVAVRGSKNGVTKHIVAAMLADSPSTISNCPDVGDVHITGGMMSALGCDISLDGVNVTVDPRPLNSSRVPLRFSGMNRIPILMVGPLLHRTGEAFVPLVGGDDIGARPLDFHVDALTKMGAKIEVTSEGLEAKASRLKGAHIKLPYPSVGATETVLMTASLAEGRTVLDNGALEPEVIELALFLQRMGAQIEMRPGRRFIIDGVKNLTGAKQRLKGDRIEAFSYLVAGLITGGEVRVHGCSQDRLVTAISTLSRMGATFDITETSVSAKSDRLTPAAVETNTHPGFMTDWQSPMVALFTQCDGLSVMTETVYENRFTYVPALNKMGAQIEAYNTPLGSGQSRFVGSSTPCSVIVRGGAPLKGAEVTVPDIRGGFAYVLAAAAANEPTTITNTHHLDRGYNRPIENFQGLGLDIRRITAEDPPQKNPELTQAPIIVPPSVKAIEPEPTTVTPPEQTHTTATPVVTPPEQTHTTATPTVTPPEQTHTNTTPTTTDASTGEAIASEAADQLAPVSIVRLSNDKATTTQPSATPTLEPAKIHVSDDQAEQTPVSNFPTKEPVEKPSVLQPEPSAPVSIDPNDVPPSIKAATPPSATANQIHPMPPQPPDHHSLPSSNIQNSGSIFPTEPPTTTQQVEPQTSLPPTEDSSEASDEEFKRDGH